MNIERAIEKFESHGFDVSFFNSGEEAARHIAARCAGKTVGIGGSVTAQQLSLYDRLSENGEVYSHQRTPDAKTYAAAAGAQVYICSANALSETGEIVNIDGRGNRVSAMLFGHERLIIVAGVNKLTPDLDSAVFRARNIASPLNARRLGRKTPCAMGAEPRCYDCSSPERICRGFVVMTNPMMGMACELVLVNEELGY